MERLTDSRATIRRWTLDRPILSHVVSIVAYIGFAKIGFLLASIYNNVSPIWPPSGLAVSLLVIGGYRLAPSILVGAFLANAMTDLGLLASASIAIGNTGEALLARALLGLFLRFETRLKHCTFPLWLISSSALATSISATVGLLSISYLQTEAPHQLISGLWTTWWTGDAIGILTITPLLLSIHRPKINLRWVTRACLLTLFTGITYCTVFLYDGGTPLLFLCLPLILLANAWFKKAGCALITFSFVAFASLMSHLDISLFEQTYIVHQQIVTFNIFIAAYAITSIAISTCFPREDFSFVSIILILGWSVSGWLYYSLEKKSSELDQVRFQQLVNDAQDAIQTRITIYEDVLRSAASYYVNSTHVSRKEWKSYVDYLNIQQRYPGINGLGFIIPFYEYELGAFVEETRAEGLTDFKIKEVPDVERPPPDGLGIAHYIITHIEPLEINRQALGLNIASERNRQSAGQRSRDGDEPALTDRIILVQDGQHRPGFLFLLPMYEQEHPTETVEQRREAFIGWTYAPFITELFFHGILGQRDEQMYLAIYDSPHISPESIVYSSKDVAQHQTEQFEEVTHLSIGGKYYSFGWNRGPLFKQEDTRAPTIAAASLALGTCLLAGIILSLQNTTQRANEIAEAKTAELLKLNKTLQKEVRDRKSAEDKAVEAHKEAEQANLAKSEFLATMSHEIRTPMNSVLGFSELLAKSPLNEQQKLWTQYIQTSGKSLLHIINDILDYSKIEAGKLSLEHAPFSLNAAIEEVISSFGVMAKEKGIVLRYEKTDLPELVVGDSIRLKQIISNLISNALKFTAEGSVEVIVDWTGTVEEGQVDIRVIDTGIGIPPNKLGKLFEKFTQADSSTTRQFGGTGLGLAICKNIAELMNGRIRAESTLGEGTSMIVEIPFKVSKEPAPAKAAPEAESAPPESQPQYNSEVLLVDDNEINQYLATTILERLGCKVTVAENGEKALEALKSKRFPIIFLDCQMPVMDGYATSAEIRKLEAAEHCATLTGQDPIKIIALTADVAMESREKCLRAGMDDFVRKPSKFNDFQNMLKKYSQS